MGFNSRAFFSVKGTSKSKYHYVLKHTIVQELAGTNDGPTVSQVPATFARAFLGGMDSIPNYFAKSAIVQ